MKLYTIFISILMASFGTVFAQNETTKSENTDSLEIVDDGYQKKLKARELGAISVVTKEQIMLSINAGIQQAMQGRASGVYVTSSGAPGKAASVRIRASSSFVAGSDPLYVVDNMPVSAEHIDMLNPNDVERIDILKDASSCAIYGSRGANGVVVITTKRGYK